MAPGLESLDDADLIRGKILLAFERAEEMAALGHADTEGIRQLLTFVLVGAGTVGVEMAVVHIYFLIGFANRFFVMLQWVLTFLTKRRQVRVFPGQERAAESP